MKKTIIIMLILGGMINTIAQVPTRMFEKGKVFETIPELIATLNNTTEIKIPAFDVTPLLEEDKAFKDLDIPFRFGKSFDVDLALKDGKWQKTDSTNSCSIFPLIPLL